MGRLDSLQQHNKNGAGQDRTTTAIYPIDKLVKKNYKYFVRITYF